MVGIFSADALLPVGVSVGGAIITGLGMAFGFGKAKGKLDSKLDAMSTQIGAVATDMREHREESGQRSAVTDSRIDAGFEKIDRRLEKVEDRVGISERDIARIQGAAAGPYIEHVPKRRAGDT